MVPAKLAGLLAAQADLLADHTKSLDGDDAAARPELDAYTELAVLYRSGADQLETIAARMAASRDLPMAPHDEAVLGSDASVAVFRRFVEAEQDAVQTLQSMVEQHQAMLSDG